MVRGYPGALFVAAGGYHHHLGLNTWATAGGLPPIWAARPARLRDPLCGAARARARRGRVADAGYACARTASSGRDGPFRHLGATETGA